MCEEGLGHRYSGLGSKLVVLRAFVPQVSACVHVYKVFSSIAILENLVLPAVPCSAQEWHAQQDLIVLD